MTRDPEASRYLTNLVFAVVIRATRDDICFRLTVDSPFRITNQLDMNRKLCIRKPGFAAMTFQFELIMVWPFLGSIGFEYPYLGSAPK